MRRSRGRVPILFRNEGADGVNGSCGRGHIMSRGYDGSTEGYGVPKGMMRYHRGHQHSPPPPQIAFGTTRRGISLLQG